MKTIERWKTPTCSSFPSWSWGMWRMKFGADTEMLSFLLCPDSNVEFIYFIYLYFKMFKNILITTNLVTSCYHGNPVLNEGGEGADTLSAVWSRGVEGLSVSSSPVGFFTPSCLYRNIFDKLVLPTNKQPSWGVERVRQGSSPPLKTAANHHGPHNDTQRDVKKWIQHVQSLDWGMCDIIQKCCSNKWQKLNFRQTSVTRGSI